MTFIHDDLLLHTPAARRLYHEFAAAEPILDFHSHLPVADIAEDRRFRNLFEIWLEGDHYKWRAMRANGTPERFCTGNATPFEKFRAWAATVPRTVCNPLYHWTHLELVRYFEIHELLDESSAASIWERANERLDSGDLTACGILKRFDVTAVCTTDDPADSVRHHEVIAKAETGARVHPTFRPDKALNVHQPEAFNAWISRLELVSDVEIRDFAAFLRALEKRHEAFHAVGGRLSDHGLDQCPGEFCTDAAAAAIFDRAREGRAANFQEHAEFSGFMMLFFGRLDAERGWTKQLHIGAMRNNITRLLRTLGPDTGFDAIGDFPQARSLVAYLDRLDAESALPKTIIYNLNPADNYVVASIVGSFQDGSLAGKIQLGSGWWFLDQKEGMEWQLKTISNLGLLSRFVGMVTDSRSFMSYPRHEYFRRVVCNLVGRDVEAGEIPNENSLLEPLIRNVCYRNARDFLGLATA